MYTLSNMIRVKTGYDLLAKGYTPDQMIDVMYDLTASHEQERLLLESATLDEIDEWYNVGDIHEMILEAITIKRYSQADGKLKALARVLEKHLPENIEVEKDEQGGYAVQIGKPKKTGSLFATVTAMIPFTDGQALSIIFHSPDGDKTKIAASDEIIAFRFLLNKRDITHVVSPEKGKDVSLDEISKRVTRIVAKTSEKFQAKQKAIQEQKAELVQVEADIETATIQLDNEIKAAEKAKVDLAAIEPKVEAAKTQVEKLEKVVGEKEKRLAELQAQKTASEGKTHGSNAAPETSHPNEPIAAIEIQGSGSDEFISLFKEIPSQQVFNVGKINGSKYPKTLIGLKSKLEELVKGRFDIEDNELLFKGMSFGGELIASTSGADGQIRVFTGDTKLTVKGKGYKQVYAKELAQAIIEQSLIDVVAPNEGRPNPESAPQPEATPRPETATRPETTREEKQAIQKELYSLRQEAKTLGMGTEAEALYKAKDLEGLRSLVAGATSQTKPEQPAIDPTTPEETAAEIDARTAQPEAIKPATNGFDPALLKKGYYIKRKILGLGDRPSPWELVTTVLNNGFMVDDKKFVIPFSDADITHVRTGMPELGRGELIYGPDIQPKSTPEAVEPAPIESQTEPSEAEIPEDLKARYKKNEILYKEALANGKVPETYEGFVTSLNATNERGRTGYSLSALVDLKKELTDVLKNNPDDKEAQRQLSEIELGIITNGLYVPMNLTAYSAYLQEILEAPEPQPEPEVSAAEPEAVTLANDILSGEYDNLPPDEMADLVEPIYDLPEDQYGDLMDQVDAYTTELTKKAVANI